MNDQTFVGYMCGVDFQHDREGLGGVRVYNSAEDCAENRKCTDECGMVKVEVRLVEWVKEQNFNVPA